jgi:mRNA interferase RelE/StbE
VKYKTRWKVSAQAELRRIDRTTAMTILRKVAELEQDPFGFGSTPLVTDPETRRLRVGDYRVFYSVQHDQLIIEVIRVAHRSGAYGD